MSAAALQASSCCQCMSKSYICVVQLSTRTRRLYCHAFKKCTAQNREIVQCSALRKGRTDDLSILASRRHFSTGSMHLRNRSMLSSSKRARVMEE